MKDSGKEATAKQSTTNRLIYIAWNGIWWVALLLPFTRIIDYRTGFTVLFVVTIMRAFANLYRNNFLDPEQAANFALRSP